MPALAVAIESVAAVRGDLRERVFGDGWSAILSVRTHDLDAFEESFIRLVDLVTR